jgi:hypothetical protein
MGLFGQLFNRELNKVTPDLLKAIERAVAAVEPLLKQSGAYPEIFLKPVTAAFEYAHTLAAKLPGPVMLSRESFAMDALVHALFASVDSVNDALVASHAVQDYQREFPGATELYALMGMRMFEKSIIGVDLQGAVVQREVKQNVVYFTSHTIENPASSEMQARELAAWSLFDSLIGKVKKRVEARRQDRISQLHQKDMLVARLRVAEARERQTLELAIADIISRLQAVTPGLDDYMEDFEAVLLNPEQHLRLAQIHMVLDNMGIRRDSTDANDPIVFNELIGFDRRDWVLTMVHCSNLQNTSYAQRLDNAYRKLSI